MSPLAVITIVQNAGPRLPHWLAHYSRQLGLEHCYVIDEGSSDGSTDDLKGAVRLSIPASSGSEERRIAFVSRIAAGLLNYYKCVAYVAADELLLADPRFYASLAAYAEAMRADAVTSIGLALVQAEGEPVLDPARSVGEQRGSVVFSSSMCKTNLISRSVAWAPGWHSHDGPPQFDGLYLFQVGEGTALGALPLAEDAGIGDLDGPLGEDLAAFMRDTVAPASSPQAYAVPLARYGARRIPLAPEFREALSAKPI